MKRGDIEVHASPLHTLEDPGLEMESAALVLVMSTGAGCRCAHGAPALPLIEAEIAHMCCDQTLDRLEGVLSLQSLFPRES